MLTYLSKVYRTLTNVQKFNKHSQNININIVKFHLNMLVVKIFYSGKNGVEILLLLNLSLKILLFTNQH